jgi:uncharacterized protein
MRTRMGPEFTDLDQEQIDALLARNNVGRLAFTCNGEPDIRPLHYVYSGGRIYGRTSPGADFAGLQLPARVAFEVDEIEAIFRWKSVIVRGDIDLLSPEGAEADERKRAIEVLRRVVKETFIEGDPVPHRTVIFRIQPERMTGRASA